MEEACDDTGVRVSKPAARPAPLARNSALFGALVLVETVDVACPHGRAWQPVCDIERVGIGKLQRIAIGGANQQVHPLTGA